MAGTSKAAILIVDADNAGRARMQAKLEADGFRITEAVDGADARDKYWSRAPDLVPDLVIADFEMSRKHVGTGLGLPLTKRLVEMHGGSQELCSVSGEGTIVTARLPKAPAAEPLTAAG